MLILLGLLVAGGAVVAVITTLFDGGGSSYSSPTPTSSAYTPYRPTYSPSVGPSPQRPTTRPTSQPATTRPTVRRTATTTIRKPKPGPSNLDIVARNKLYLASPMKSVGCRESRARPSSPAGARANYSNLWRCLNKSWPNLVARSGNKFRPPSVVTFSGSITTPCGTNYDDGPPFYCSSTETIYMNLTEDLTNYRQPEAYNKVWARMWLLHQFAHEYGHHVQHLTGILGANWAMRYQAPSKALELEGSRRLELQASCFADIFIGANKNSYPISGQAHYQWRWLIGHVTDHKDDHGDARNHEYWAKRGYASRKPNVCNTFVASSARVK